MADLTLYEKIVRGDIPSFKVWEDATHIAFLTPFANTKGHTVVTAKVNPGANIFELSDSDYNALMNAAKVVASKIKLAFKIDKVGMVIDGTGVPHAHVQLLPLHGYSEGQEVPSTAEVYNENYAGYVTSANGPKMEDVTLEEIRKKIAEAEIQ
jgi:histidine triad (HIT) family protein